MSARLPRRALLRGAALTALAGAAVGVTSPVRPSSAQSLVVAGRGRVSGWDDLGVVDWGRKELAQRGRLILPQRRAWGRDRLPVIVFYHGGGWQESSSWDYVLGAARDLARYGVAVWLPAYRGTPSPGGWPQTLADAIAGAQAVRRLPEHTPFTLDPQRIHLVGHSAGGHLAVWAAGALSGALGTGPRGTAGDDDGPAAQLHRLVAQAEVSVASATSLAGVLDPVRAVEEDQDQFVVDLLGGTPREQPERYALASPLEQLPVGFPVHVVHGIDDRTVPVQTVEPYIERLRSQGRAGRVELVPGAQHNDLIQVQDPAWAVAREVCLAAVGAPHGS